MVKSKKKPSDSKYDSDLYVAKTPIDSTVGYGKTYAPQDEIPSYQKVRAHPTIYALTANQKSIMYNLVKDYMRFLDNARISSDAVKEVEVRARKENFLEEGGLFVTNREETCFGLIKPGKRPISEGIRIFYSHNDSPCLRIKPMPLLFQWDTDLRDLHLGVRLDTTPYGGVQLHSYEGRAFTIKGEVYPMKTGKKREISFRGFIPDHSAHIDPRSREGQSFDQAHSGEDLDISLPDCSKQAFLNRVKMEADDFLSARLYAFPDVKTEKYGNFILGYGHDAKVGIYTTLNALFRSDPVYTTLVVGFDREEVDSGGTSGARGKFLEDLIIQAIDADPKFEGKGVDEKTMRQILNRSYAINADVDVGSTTKEESNTQFNCVGKLGYGVGILGQDGGYNSDQVLQSFISQIRRTFRSNGIVSQGIANPQNVDLGEIPTFGEFISSKGIETLCLPCVVGGLHSPTEVIHEGDLYYTFEAYRTLMEDKFAFDNTPIVKKK